MTAVIIPFGKHKGKTVEEVETLDPQYLHFLEQQEWMREKFPSILAAAASLRGDEHQRTPEHNALQMRLLDAEFRERMMRILGHKSANEVQVKFELSAGWDAHLQWYYWNDEQSCQYTLGIVVEIKTWLGDEYPSVLRQINRQKERSVKRGYGGEYIRHPTFGHIVLLTRGINATQANASAIREFFYTSGVTLMSEEDIDRFALPKVIVRSKNRRPE